MEDHKLAFAAQVAGVLVWGAIYVLGIIVAAIVGHSPDALYLALASAGTAYLCFAAQIMRLSFFAVAFMAISVGTSIAAGIALIKGL